MYIPEGIVRVDEDHGPGGRSAGHGGHEIGQTVLSLQVVQSDVGVGGL